MKITRNDLLKWEKTAVSSEEVAAFLNCLKEWITVYPGDLEIRYLYAKTLISKQSIPEGISELQTIITIHPEYKNAYNLLYKYCDEEEKRREYYDYLNFYNISDSREELGSWSGRLKEVDQALKQNNATKAESELFSLLQEYPDNVLIAIYHTRFVMQSTDDYSILQIARRYSEKWNSCVFFNLVYANILFKFGSEIEAMQLLRDAVFKDHTGVVARELWGEEHAYSHLWLASKDFFITHPDDQTLADLNLKEPSQKDSKQYNVSTISGQSGSYSRSIFSKPAYVLMSTKKGITAKYGENTFSVIQSRMQELADAIAKRENWDAFVFIPDDENCMLQYGLRFIESNDPWEFKLALHDLSNYFQERGKKIGSLLIVGGDDLIPFHRLPNPTDDSDVEVLSDNPYATDDSNYFVPQWAVGRFPDEKGSDPGLLLKQLREAIKWHKEQNQHQTLGERIGEALQFWNAFTNMVREMNEKRTNYGYSTAIWQRSSIAAFRPIGKANYIRISPPYNVNNLDAISIKEAEFAYFNLHGLDDSPNWYGQKDISNTDNTPDFPVAIQPSLIDPQATKPAIVLSEACYGSYIINKTSDESLSLRFLTSSCRAFIGSTCIAYGSIYPPLIGADQLAYFFWNLIEKNYTVGDAYIRAKMNLMKSILRRQGYLDGEDQKTLLSFVLYGDPLYFGDSNSGEHLMQEEEKYFSPYQVVADRDLEDIAIPAISAEILSNVKEVVKEYLPGIESANLSVREKQMKIRKLGTQNKGAEIEQDQTASRVFLTYTKNFQVQNRTIKQYTRVTLDEKGKMVKLSVSK
ncbi:MAG TPA: hypothetical protein DCK95_02110 [Anaerolineaceae bacterium]|uniref:Uncharacterized protein n=1 Tax=Anaerolinea thermophila TaxID=167964 RepID=A0A101FYF8_9CHLR|nr:MAG: hypothetical protein XD73_0318 [Anaerolinea thermophila]HAF61101.1 hypothetical protein [Anaerolineaceae bacterium]